VGFKAPLAYSSSFYFICRKDGMERKYMMYEGEEVNTIDLLYEAPTDQPNGVKVIVPINYYDRYAFESKIKEQLAYFEKVFFNVDGISNDFIIVRSEHFQFSELGRDSYMHICLDNVYYPLDFSKLEIPRINIPVGLRFSLTDGIYPTPNRESIRYTQEAKEVILNKIREVANYFVQKYNETVEDTADLKTVIEHYTSKRRNVPLSIKGNVDVNQLFEFATIQEKNPTVKDVNLLDVQRLIRIQEYILGEYELKFLVNNKSIRDGKRYYWYLSHLNRIPETVYIYSGDKLPGIKKDYIKYIHTGKDAIVLKKTKPFPLFGQYHRGNYDNYCRLLELKQFPKTQWRQRIQEFQSIINSYAATFINLDEMVVPQDFIEMKKKSKPVSTLTTVVKTKRVKLQGELICKEATNLERWVDGKTCKWVSKTYDMANFHKNAFLMVYGKHEDAAEMDKWYKYIKHRKMKLVTFSERELKLVKGLDLHNLISFSDFMKGDNKPFQRIATACLIDQLRDKYPHVFSEYMAINDISEDLYKRISNLRIYLNKNFEDVSNVVRDIIVEHAKEINKFDPTIYDDIKAVEEVCEKLPFLNVMFDVMPSYNPTKREMLMKSLIDLLKYHKHRVNWKHYKITLNEDAPLEDELSEETVETLIEQN
jgi:hypothetical protein